MAESVTLYKSNFCPHSLAIEQYLRRRKVPLHIITIDGNREARLELMALNNGLASVPTLLFADGTQLTEPSFGDLRRKLGSTSPGLLDRLKGVFGR